MNPTDALMNQVEWAPVTTDKGDGTLPYVTHEGVFRIDNLGIRCYRLNDGRAILNAEDVNRFFGELLGPEEV